MTHRGVLIKLLSLVGISVVAFAAIGIYGISNTSSTFTWVEKVYSTAEDFRNGALEITNPLNELRQLSLSIVMAPNPKLQKQLDGEQQEKTRQLDHTFAAWNDKLQREGTDRQEREAFDRLLTSWADATSS